jgi:hypothetical protein
MSVHPFDEHKHPRGKGGEWINFKGGKRLTAAEQKARTPTKRLTRDGKAAKSHLAAMGIHSLADAASAFYGTSLPAHTPKPKAKKSAPKKASLAGAASTRRRKR